MGAVHMALQFGVYNSEVFNFLKTVTIKFEPFTSIIKNNLLIYHNIDVPEDSNPYYDNLLGLFKPSDEPMYIFSVDTNEVVLLDKTLKINHPKTASVCKVTNTEYDTLCKKYPDQIDLVKAIVYPVADIRILRESPPLALVGYDASLLQPTEQASIIAAIHNYLDYMYRRWWVKEYVYEEYYAIGFYATVWQYLPLIIMTQRIKNIKTSSVHPMHIWEYLISHGLGDYRDILTTKQSHWLYRNIEYLIHNRGKSHNLRVLADNLLNSLQVSLVGKTIRQQEIDGEVACIRTPEIISEKIVSYRERDDLDALSFETIQQINQRMFLKNIEVNNDVEYTDKLLLELGNAEENRLQTKLLELKKETIDTRYESLLIQFIYDNLIYRIIKKNVAYRVKLTDEVSGFKLDLSINDAILLYYWACFKSINEEPIIIPNKATVRIPYKLRCPSRDELPSKMWFNGVSHPMSTCINMDFLLESIPWDIGPFTDSTSFMFMLGKHFDVMMTHLRESRSSADWLYTSAMLEIYHKCMDCGTYDISLTPHTTFEGWFNSDDQLKLLRDQYESLSTTAFYNNLSTMLISTMLPVDNDYFKPYLGAPDDMNALFDGLKSLFIQLCSYNVTFLDTDRIKQLYLFLTPYAQMTVSYLATSTNNSIVCGLVTDMWGKCKFPMTMINWLPFIHDQWTESFSIFAWRYTNMTNELSITNTVVNSLVGPKIEYETEHVISTSDVNVSTSLNITYNFDDLI